MPEKCQECGSKMLKTGLTPVAHEERAGLDTLSYRVGTHARFQEAMKNRIASHPALRALTTREEADPSIALLDACATMLDVITFYSERIVNEGFLRTATERRSIGELAAQIGYALNPGVAGSAALAFTVEDAPGAPGWASIDAGTKVQSLPGPGETPQIYETLEKLTARAEFDRLFPKIVEKQSIHLDMTSLYLKGTNLQLAPGDMLLIVGDERLNYGLSENWDSRVIDSVCADINAGHTRVTWQKPLGFKTATKTVQPARIHPKVYVMRKRASLFGHNAPDPLMLHNSGESGHEWTTDFYINQALQTLDVSGAHPKILQDGWVILSRPGTNNDDYTEAYRVTKVSLLSRKDFGLSSEITRLVLDTGANLNLFGLRETAVYAENEELELADMPYRTLQSPQTPGIRLGEGMLTPVQGAQITLNRYVPGLQKGQRLIVSGKAARLTNELEYVPSDPKDDAISETAVIESVGEADDQTILYLSESLQNVYDRATVILYANCAPATHGETKKEILGSGNAAEAFQKFVLRQTPLTYISAATAGGSVSTLEIRVDDLLWSEVPSLYGQGAKAQVYTTRIDDNGKVTVQFGDGLTGARLPSGVENITATYRVGTGEAGLVKPGQLSLLLTRPLGVKAAVNPGAPSGAKNPETRDEARVNAPSTVQTFDRIVSLADYENFVRRFAGIGKARAQWLWTGRLRLAHLTITGVNGAAIREDSDLFVHLQDAIKSCGLPRQRFLLQSTTPAPFSLKVNMKVKSGYLTDKVLSAVRLALKEAYAFDKRTFCQAVTQSDVLALISAIDGVEMADLDELRQAGQSGFSLRAHEARYDKLTGEISPAELLTIDPAGIDLMAITE